MRKRSVGWFVLLFASVGIASSCVGDEATLDEAEYGDEFESIRRRLGISVRPGPDGYAGFPNVGTEGDASGCNTVSCMPDLLELGIGRTCSVLLMGDQTGVDPCRLRSIEVESRICVANRLLELIDSPGPREVEFLVPTIGHSGPGTVIIPPQDAESDSEMARLAAESAQEALSAALSALDSATPAVCSDAVLASTFSADNELSVAEVLAYQYREAMELVNEAGARMAQTGAAVSDAAYARNTDRADAARDALAPFASRTAAAHMLVGGDFGLPAIAGVAEEGFYTRSSLSGEGQQALTWFRAAAIAPALIGAEGPSAPTMDELAMGSGPVAEVDSLRFRLGHMQSRDLLLTAPSADVVYEQLGVSRRGFSEARELLREELRAFDRSPEVLVPAEPLPDGTMTDTLGIELYAATRVPPTQLLTSYWAAVLRYDPTPPVDAGISFFAFGPDAAGNLPPGDTWGEEILAIGASGYVTGRRSLASVLDEAHRHGADVLERLCPGGVCGAGLEDAAEVVAQAIADFAPMPELETGTSRVSYESAPYLGRARACWYQVGGFRVYAVQVASPIPAEELLVVEGRDGLECAVRGALEGVPCDEDQWAGLRAPSSVWFPIDASHPELLTAFVYNVDPGARPTANTVPLFVVRRRPGLGMNEPSLPGQYEEVTGFILPDPGDAGIGYRYCVGAPIVPRLERQAAGLIMPSTSAPFRPAESCAGLPSDMRIPLENELTSITSGRSDIESSWFHYLQLAERAASEADSLGEDVIRTGLEMDSRAESASDELSRLCGVDINLTSIAGALEADSVPRVASSAPPCALPYVQQDTQCVLDPVLYAASRAGVDDDMGRLAACVGADVVPWATLGDQPLCAWDATPGEAGGICEGRGEEMPCPVTADSTGACPGFAMPEGAELIVATTRLNLFTQPAEPVPVPPNPDDLPCSALSQLRAGVPLSAEVGPEGETLDQQLTSLLQWDTMSRLTRHLTWEALVGDYSSVRYAGSIVFRTGSVTNPSPTQWPMGAAPTGACPADVTPTSDPADHTGPLFCLRGLGAAGRLERARMNDLLLRAVFGARIFTGVGLQGNVVPYYSSNRADVYRIDESSFAWSPLVGTTPRTSCTPIGQLRVDHQEPGDLAEEYALELNELGSRACRIANPVAGSSGMGCGTSIPAGAEWAVCPYDQGSCEVFDDQDDCDDGLTWDPGVASDRNMPLVLRAVDDELNLLGAAETAARMWDDGFASALRARATRAVRAPAQELTDTSISDLTRYFLSGEGDDGRVPARCLREYEDCVDGLPGARLMVDGNLARVPGRLNVNDVLNGLELACYAARQGLPPSDLAACDAPAEINDLTDAWRMAGYMDCAANTLNGRGANSLVAGLPSRVVEIMQSSGGPDNYGAGAGELDAEISELRAALVALGAHRINIAADLRAYASRIRSLQMSVSQSERSREIEDLMFTSRTADRVTQCATAVLNATAASVSPDGAAGAGFRAASAATTCVNSAVQIGLDRRITDLRLAGVEDALLQEFQSFDGETAEFSRRMSERALAIRSELERFDGALARLRGNQMQARRALSRALLLDDGGMDAYMNVNRVYRGRYNTLLQRYLRSHTRAVRAAFIARLALEQRLGMPLADISDDVFSDEPPSEWVDTICSLPSIDYDALRGATPGPTGERDSDTVEFAGPDDYSGAYVGDYVRRLRDVFESYSFVHPFREGTDTAAISLRDDVFATRAPCDIAPPNVLFNGGRLDVLAGRDRLGWRVEGCDASFIPSAADRQCVSIDRLEDTADMPAGARDTSRPGAPIPYRLRFGETLAATAEARVEQSITLGRGRHRLSWYARDGAVGGIAGASAVQAWDTESASLITGGVSQELVEGSAGWSRYWFFFDVADDEAAVRVVIPFGGTPGVGRDVDLAGVMLERVETSFGDDPRGAPPPFFEPGDSGVTEVRDCVDRGGVHFRREAWTYDCVRVCTDGYDGNCPAEWSEARCYWETSFDASSDSLQQLLVAGDAGFASGNYNYRIESVGVNLIGTGLRDCEASEGTAGCYASGNLSFSMLHQGPFMVRNALGRLYEAPLFPGRVESARALAAERYLTNPLSSADRALMEPYTRVELQGRPLGGTLTLRLWDDPRFRFDRLEDVQVLLTYRYWQHQR